MEECGWTRYGRVAKLSIKKEKAYYQSKLDINSYYNLLNFLRTYKGNPDVPIVISNAMSNVYKDKKSMRYEAYEFEDETLLYDNQRNEIERWKSFYGSAYQKIDSENVKQITKNNRNVIVRRVQKQMPAYLTMSIANAMHGKVPYWDNENGKRVLKIREQSENERLFFIIKVTENQKALFKVPLCNNRLNNARNKIVFNSGDIQHPHYLESYYILTKMIKGQAFK